MSTVKFPWNKIHFVGVGGVGMAGLATILAERNTAVSGSDMRASAYTRQVEAMGGRVSIGHTPANLPDDAELVVYSAAVTDDNPELVAARAQGVRCVVRGEFLAELAACYPCVVAVAGSHGKTTTTALLAHILRETGYWPGYLVGGEVTAWTSSAAAGRGDILVTEVDESDGTQAFMKSSYGVVINVEDDHCWNLGGLDKLEECFRTFARNADHLLAWASEKTSELFAFHPDLGLLDQATIPSALKLQIPGEHNRINASLAIAAARQLGVKTPAAIKAVESFAGVRRRMTRHFMSADRRVYVIEDYAHHPTELAATLQALRDTYPEARLVAAFQPHRFERVKRYAREFSRLLETADEAVVVKPFAAWVNDGSNVRPEMIAREIRKVPATYWDRSPEELGKHLAQAAKAAGDSARTVIAILGAGDICDAIPSLKEHITAQVLKEYQNDLVKICPSCVAHRLGAWGDYTTLGIGRAKPLVVEPAGVTELRYIFRTARRQNLPVFFLGHGSNIVGSDELQQQVVVRLHGPAFTNWSSNGRFIRAGAGLSLSKLLRELAELGLLSANAAPLGWIPGAVGGAIRMNAGADGAEVGQFVDRLTGVTLGGKTWERRGADIDWQYRETDIPADVCITEVLFRFGRGDRQAALTALQASGEARRKTQPQGRTAGCAFRNAGVSSAGKLLDKAGCKDLTVGKCRISRKHANFLMAGPNAGEAEYVTLMRLAQQKVRDASGVHLQPEVICVHPESNRVLAAAASEVPHVVVLQGGPSAEHDISLKSAAAVAGALREAGLRVTQVDVPAAQLPRLPAGTDVVFPVLHGAFGEDGGVQALLEKRALPYVGSGVRASADTMSKTISKKIFLDNGIPTPASRKISTSEAPIPADLSFPLVVKPVNQGSTYGLTVLKRPSGWWKRALRVAFDVDDEVMAEEFVEGIEITVGLINGAPLPVVEIVPPGGRIFDFDAKYDHKRGHTRYFCPSVTLSTRTRRAARQLAVRVYDALGAEDMLRVDMIIDRHDALWVLEANSIPGFTATSLLPMAAAQAGIAFPELCAQLVHGAVTRQRMSSTS